MWPILIAQPGDNRFVVGVICGVRRPPLLNPLIARCSVRFLIARKSPSTLHQRGTWVRNLGQSSRVGAIATFFFVSRKFLFSDHFFRFCLVFAFSDQPARARLCRGRASQKKRPQSSSDPQTSHRREWYHAVRRQFMFVFTVLFTVTLPYLENCQQMLSR